MSEIIIIAAVAANNVIGKGNTIPWHISADFKHFKELTHGSPVIMGARTWESLPRKPLPGRKNIVLSRHAEFYADGATVVRSLDEALALCQGEGQVSIIGGASVYAESMKIATKLELTRLSRVFDGDTQFPEVDTQFWHLEQTEKQPDDAEYGPYAYETWVRKGI